MARPEPSPLAVAARLCSPGPLGAMNPVNPFLEPRRWLELEREKRGWLPLFRRQPEVWRG